MAFKGLTASEAAERLKTYGKNIHYTFKVSALSIFLRQFASPLIYLLILAAVISLFLSSFVDALTISAILLMNALLGFFQEYRSEKFIDKLGSLIKKTAKVRRDNKIIQISQEEIVIDDIVHISEGDIIPADGSAVFSESLQVDESTITGESEPLSKSKEDKVFAGCVVTHGYGEFKVTATGTKTQLGQISYLSATTMKVSKYEESVRGMSKTLMKVTLAILLLIFAVNLLVKGLTVGNLISFLLFTLALAISIVPEALPVITTLSLSRGALKLSKKHVVVKRLSSVEDLGNIEVLCTDKTGTITKNSLIVKDIYCEKTEDFFAYLNFSLFENSPLDGEIKKKIPANINGRVAKIRLKEFLPFDPALRRRWALVEEGGKRYLLVLGAAEEIVKLTPRAEKTFMSKFKELESDGLRILALGFKEVKKGFSLKKEFNDKNLEFLGYLTIFDPIRETALSAINIARKLKVDIKILTGDSLEVAKYAAKKINLLTSGAKCYTGQELEALSASKFDEVCASGVVFARVAPEQKYRIIESLKKKYVVGYQGDGINDAPALKLANVGIAVNDAADVAREAADIVLLQKDLKVIVEGIESGRKIFNNIDKYIKHTMVSNWGNFFAVAIVSIFTNFIPLLPIQILLTGLFSDIPLLAVSGDNVDNQDLRRPEKYDIFELVSLPIVLGTVTAIFNLVFFIYVLSQPLDLRRTTWFLLITVMDLVVIFSVRKRTWMTKGIKPSRILTGSIIVWILASLALPFTFFSGIFHLVKVSFGQELLIILVMITYLFVLDASKVFYYKRLINGKNLFTSTLQRLGLKQINVIESSI